VNEPEGLLALVSGFLAAVYSRLKQAAAVTVFPTSVFTTTLRAQKT
jgi:hypothetical protein